VTDTPFIREQQEVLRGILSEVVKEVKQDQLGTGELEEQEREHAAHLEIEKAHNPKYGAFREAEGFAGSGPGPETGRWGRND
jgi:hypothetical protein